MPPAVHPQKSAAHRVACVSLYRALLRQSNRFTTQNSSLSLDVLRSLITFRFRKDRELKSPRQITNGLSAGNSILTTLRNATSGSTTALSHLSRILQSTLQLADAEAVRRRMVATRWQPPTVAVQNNAEARSYAATKKNHRRREGNPSILERPLPLDQINPGGRKVPYLVSARGIPFLRYPGKQPESLGRLIRQRDAWHVKRDSQSKQCQADRELGRLEDQWDTLLHQEFPRHLLAEADKDPWGKPRSWAESAVYSLTDIANRITDQTRKHEEMGRLMWEVVKKEKALAEEEAAASKAKKGSGEATEKLAT